MNITNSKILLAVLLVSVLFASCDTWHDDNSQSDQYSYYINIGEFSTLNSVKNYRIGLPKELNQKAVIQKISDRSYRLLVGKYISSYDAGKDAYRFYSNGLFRNYSIMKNGREVLDEFRNILFVAYFQGRPSVYELDILSKKIGMIWSRWGSKVISLNVSEGRQTAFILSALAFGKRGGLSYITDVRVFLLNREKNEYYEKSALGDGVQLYTYWENADTFKVNLTSIDSVNSRFIFQNIFPFDLNGKRANIHKRKFDLITDGFPLPPQRNPIYFSPNSRFQLRQSTFNNEHDIYLKDLHEKSEILVASSIRKIADARWSEDGNYLFLVTDNTVPSTGKRKAPPSGELIVINAVQKKQVNLFSGYRYKNILVHGDFLLFDERSSSTSKINILNYRQNKTFYTISMPGGCGLNNLPM